MSIECNTEKFYLEFGNELKGFIKKRVYNESIVEDILHDSFIKINQCCEEQRHCDSPKSYIFQIVNNTVADYFRSTKKRNLDIYAQEPSTMGNSNEEMNLCLNNYIDQLPDKYKQAIILADIKEYPQKEIAEILSISLSATKSRIQRARKKLKVLLLQSCQINSDCYGNVVNCEEKK